MHFARIIRHLKNVKLTVILIIIIHCLMLMCLLSGAKQWQKEQYCNHLTKARAYNLFHYCDRHAHALTARNM